ALGGTPIGAPIVGWVADHLGPRWALGVGAVSGILAVGVALYTLKRQMDRPASITSAPPTRKPEDSPTT
ncbi:MFS transporter, partial [Pseudomonas sp. MAFF 311097]|nr:MFS transporter [Pseudomonas petroselini]